MKQNSKSNSLPGKDNIIIVIYVEHKTFLNNVKYVNVSHLSLDLL